MARLDAPLRLRAESTEPTGVKPINARNDSLKEPAGAGRQHGQARDPEPLIGAIDQGPIDSVQ